MSSDRHLIHYDMRKPLCNNDMAQYRRFPLLGRLRALYRVPSAASEGTKMPRRNYIVSNYI
jgi:hypothetical protein